MTLASTTINDHAILSKADVEALSKSFGNFDRIVGLGWLLPDAVSLPLGSRAQAYAVGLKARREAVAVEKAERKLRNDNSRAKSKLPAADAGRQQLDENLAKELARLLREPVDVGLSADQAQTKLSQASRKRSAPAAEPSAEELLAAANCEVLAAEKEVKRAKVRTVKARDKLERAEANPGQPLKLIYALMYERYAEGELLRALLARKEAMLTAAHLQWSAALDEADEINRQWGAELDREEEANQRADRWEQRAHELLALAKARVACHPM